ncbi:MAG TPA: hypothetical protein VI248_12025 [Kineosporiaceae bacterium]
MNEHPTGHDAAGGSDRHSGPPSPPPPPPPDGGAAPDAAPSYGTPSYAAPSYGAPSYGAPPPEGYGTPPSASAPGYAYPPVGPYAPYVAQPTAPVSASTVVLTIIAGLLTVSCYFSLAGIPALVLAIIALTRNATDPTGARRLTRIGWIVLGSVFALIVIAIVVFIAAAVHSASPTTPN